MTEEEKEKYFGNDARMRYFDVYRQLSKDTNVVPSKEDWATYKAPEFDDGSYFQADSDEDEDDIMMDHDVGVFSTSALTPRHKMNRAIIAKQTGKSDKLGVASQFVLSEPIMIRTLSVLGTSCKGGGPLQPRSKRSKLQRRGVRCSLGASF